MENNSIIVQASDMKNSTQCTKEDNMLSFAEVDAFYDWIIDNWRRTSYCRWQNQHTYEMIDTTQELYARFKSNSA